MQYPAVLHGINLTIAPGERVGLIGPSGAGKSTLVNLLLHFYDPASGRILIDGQDIAGVTQESLRRHIAMVTQDTSLLHRSIRENIRYGQPQATDAQIVAAAKQAHAHDFILGLEDWHGRSGYDAHVGERGVKLSGGQRQRVALARVILKDAPILILDEATSALDSEVEAAIQEQLDTLMEGRTVIAIAHRLSTIARMDRLIVLDEGRIVEVRLACRTAAPRTASMPGCGGASQAASALPAFATASPPSSVRSASAPSVPAGMTWMVPGRVAFNAVTPPFGQMPRQDVSQIRTSRRRPASAASPAAGSGELPCACARSRRRVSCRICGR